MYTKFDLKECASMVHHYINSMVDKSYDNLPYWLILPNKKPAEAAHCRVDDAELVGSWYEGLVCSMDILDTQEGEDVRVSLRNHLMKSWGEHGLRFCEKYPWTHTVHSSFHEMGYIMSGLNKITEKFPDDEENEKRTSELVRGMRSLVIERKVKTFWSGDSFETEPIYEFPNDVYLKDGGFDLTRHTGRGEQAIRNGVVLYPLVRRYELTRDEVALDLATGIANYVLGPSRYFNYRMEFFGHVHSAVWFACGLVKLGMLTDNKVYIEKGKKIYDYVRSLSSSFGWVPEYAQWHPMDEEHCETCCIKDMIECARLLVDCGYASYWDDINRFARNQLVENQVRYTEYVVCDNSLPDGDGITYHDIDKRIVGGFTGGSEPNSISLTRFRSIAGCCVGTAPVALKTVWDSAVTSENNAFIVNIPMFKDTSEYTIDSDIPNTGLVSITAKKDMSAGFRIYEWNREYKLKLNGQVTDGAVSDDVVFCSLKAGDTLEMLFDIETVEIKELVQDKEFTVSWRACDVVDISPRGEHVRLYQRNSEIEKYYPLPEDVEYTGAANYGPTQQKQ